MRGIALALAISLAGTAVPALAQGLITDPAAIAACLCSEQSLSALQGGMDEAQRRYEEDRAGIDALDRQIAQASTTINVSVESQVDAVKSLNDQRAQLYARTYDVELPALQQAVAAYNQAVADLTAHCAGRALDPVQKAQVEAGLRCPALRQ
jgi:predicted  nucleic acid-binding Zn-ribbon protein